VIQKTFDRIERSDIDALVAAEAKEGRSLEYKQSLPGNSNEEKREFLADVSSFANASGGDILYGIEERRNEAEKETGIPGRAPGLAGMNSDLEIRRLESKLHSGINPRIAGVQIRAVDGFQDGAVLLIRVRKSYAAPHMVVFKNLSRMFSRNSSGKYQLDVGEIRSVFALSEALPERFRRFRDDRLARIVSGEIAPRLRDGAKLALHLLPLSALDSTNQVDIQRIAAQDTVFRPLQTPSYNMRFNIDGCLAPYTDEKSGMCHTYNSSGAEQSKP
jgi:Schlafen, AlbA_2